MNLTWDLCAITDQAGSRGRGDDEIAKGLIVGGASVLQYRNKQASARDQLAMAIKLRALTLSRGVPLIVNDRIDLAVACGADGVHLGQDDLPVSAARLMVGADLIVGVSTHTLEQALRAEADGADYIAFGPVYASKTHGNVLEALGLQALAEVAAHIKIPVIASGGIKPENFAMVAATQVRCVAVVAPLTGAADVAEATRDMKARWLESRREAGEIHQKAERDKKVQSAKKVSFL